MNIFYVCHSPERQCVPAEARNVELWLSCSALISFLNTHLYEFVLVYYDWLYGVPSEFVWYTSSVGHHD